MPGFNAYSRAESSFFRGREKEVEQIRDLFQDSELILLYGPSGAGKSSLVKAGLAPMLPEQNISGVYFSLKCENQQSVLEILRLALTYPISDTPENRPPADGNEFGWSAASAEHAESVIVIDDFELVLWSSDILKEAFKLLNDWLADHVEGTRLLLISANELAIFENELPAQLHLKNIASMKLEKPSSAMLRAITDELISETEPEIAGVELGEFISAFEKENFPLAAWQYFFIKMRDQQLPLGELFELRKEKTLSQLVNEELETLWEKLDVLEKDALSWTIKSLISFNKDGGLFFTKKTIATIKNSLNRQSPAIDKMLDLFFSGGVNFFVFHESNNSNDIFLEIASPALCEIWRRSADWLAEMRENYRIYLAAMENHAHFNALPPALRGYKNWREWVSANSPSEKWGEEYFALPDKSNSGPSRRQILTRYKSALSAAFFLIFSGILIGGFLMIALPQMQKYALFYSPKETPDNPSEVVPPVREIAAADSLFAADEKEKFAKPDSLSSDQMTDSSETIRETKNPEPRSEALEQLYSEKKERIIEAADTSSAIQDSLAITSARVNQFRSILDNAQKAQKNNDNLVASYLYLEAYNAAYDGKSRQNAFLELQKLNRYLHLVGYFQPAQKIVDFEFSAEQNNLLSVEGENIVNVRNGLDGRQLTEPLRIPGQIWDIVPAIAGARFALFGNGNEIPLLFGANQKMKQASIRNSSNIAGLQFSNDGKMILYWDLENKLHLHYSINGQEKFGPVVVEQGISGASFSRNDQFIFCRTTYGEMLAFKIEDNSLDEVLLKPIEGVKKGAGCELTADNKVICWNPQGLFQARLDQLNRFEHIFKQQYAPIDNIKISISQNKLIVFDTFKFLYILNLNRPEEKPVTLQCPARAKDAFLLSKNRLLVIGMDPWVELRDLKTGEAISSWNFTSEELLNYWFFPDSEQALFVTRAGAIYVIDLNSGKIANSVLKHYPRISRAKFSKENKTLVTYSDVNNTIKMWKFEDFFQTDVFQKNLQRENLTEIFALQTGTYVTSEGKIFSFDPTSWQKLASQYF